MPQKTYNFIYTLKAYNVFYKEFKDKDFLLIINNKFIDKVKIC